MARPKKLPVPADEQPPKRGRGRPRKPVPRLSIDLTQPPESQLFPCSDNRQSTALGWHPTDVRAINATLGLYDELPMICQGEACFWAKQCPTAPNFLFQGFRCPLEIEKAYLHFVSYVREIDAEPDDHVDLKQIRELVCIDLQLRRIDQQLQMQGMLVDKVAGIVQGSDIKKVDRVVLEKGEHPLLKRQSDLRKERGKIYDALLVSRDKKREMALKEGNAAEGLLSIFDRITRKPASVQEVIDSPALPAYDPDDDPDDDFDEEL